MYRIIKWLRNRRNRGKPYKIPLEALIHRAKKRLKEETGYNKIYCPQCFIQRNLKTEMEFRASNIVIDVIPIRDDQVYKCLWCYNIVPHGIPITRKNALKEIELRGKSSYLMRPTLRPDERDMEVVKKRLRDLGYIE